MLQYIKKMKVLGNTSSFVMGECGYPLLTLVVFIFGKSKVKHSDNNMRQICLLITECSFDDVERDWKLSMLVKMEIGYSIHKF